MSLQDYTKNEEKMKKDKDEVIKEIFEIVAHAAPHISSGIERRREYVGNENPSDEKQREADVWADELLTELITSIEGVGELASEERNEIIDCGRGFSVTLDPLDGSSNIPTNNLVGTIVGIYNKELPCKGTNLEASFYVLFGPTTTIVKAQNQQVNEYVIEEKQNDKVEIHKVKEDLKLPEEPAIFGFGGNKNWTPEFREFAEEIRQENKTRYGGCLIGDINQVLHHGGIFAYPERTDAPDGKLRLLFEANPIAHIVELAEGASSNGVKPIQEIEADKLHQRTPLYLGNKSLIERRENF